MARTSRFGIACRYSSEALIGIRRFFRRLALWLNRRDTPVPDGPRWWALKDVIALHQLAHCSSGNNHIPSSTQNSVT
jgi:hypothetical protein